MGKPLPRAHLSRRKPLRAIHWKRFCSCCGEVSFKPCARLKSRRRLPKKQEAGKRVPGFGEISFVSKRAASKVNLTKNGLKSVCKLSQDYSRVTPQLKQVIVNVTRLSKDVLRVLSENGSICACDISTEGVCNLSRTSRSGKNSCLVTSTRRLRSTQIQPAIRHNILDTLRELNADWRSTTCPLSVNCNTSVSSEASAEQHIPEPELSMKTLFLENLSIRKLESSEKSAKENVKMSQKENLSAVSHTGRQNISQLKTTAVAVKPLSTVSFPIMGKSMPASALTLKSKLVMQSKVVSMDNRSCVSRNRAPNCRSLLAKPDRKKFGEFGQNSSMECFATQLMIRQNFCSLLPKPTLPLPPVSNKTLAPVPGVYQTPLKLPLLGSPTPDSLSSSAYLSRNLNAKNPSVNSSSEKNESQDNNEKRITETHAHPRSTLPPSSPRQKPKILEVKSNTRRYVSERQKIRAAKESTGVTGTSKNASCTSELNRNGNEKQITETRSSLPPISPRKSSRKPKILEVKSKTGRNVSGRSKMQAAQESSDVKCASKNVACISELNPAFHGEKPRVSRRKQLLTTHSKCCNSDPSKIGSRNKGLKPDDVSLDQENSMRMKHLDALIVDDFCSKSKKQKIEPESSVISKLAACSRPLCPEQEKSDVPAPKKSQRNDRIYTIVLSDSSDDERSNCITKKASPAKPTSVKGNAVERKRTPLRRSVLKKSQGQAASETITLKYRSRPNGSSGNINHASTPVAVDRVPRRSSFDTRNSRTLRRIKVSDSESEALNSSDSEEDSRRYVSRTGRATGITSGCRSCPGCNIDGPRRDKPKLLPTRKKRKLERKLPSPDEDIYVSDSDSYMDVVHAVSESPPTVVVHGLTSSDSSDELTDGVFLRMFEEARTALVVVPNESVGECEESPTGGEVTEEVTKALDVPSTVNGSAVMREGAVTSQKTTTSEDYSSVMIHIPQTFENEVMEPGSITKPPIEEDIRLAQIPVKLLETQSQSTDPEIDCKVDCVATIPASAMEVETIPDVLFYVSHQDSNGRILLHEYDSESSDNEISHENPKPLPQKERLEDDASVFFLTDDSSESSGNSSAAVNFDFHEYECGSTTPSTSPTPQDSSQGILEPSEGLGQVSDCGSDSFKLPKSKEDLLEESELCQGGSKSPNSISTSIYGEKTCYSTQEGQLAVDSQRSLECLASEHEPVQQSAVNEISSEIQNCHKLDDAETPVPVSIKLDEVTSCNRVDFGNLDDHNTSKFGGEPHDHAASLDHPASQINAFVCEGEPYHLEVGQVAQEASDLPPESQGDPSLVLGPVAQNGATENVTDTQSYHRRDLVHQESFPDLVNDEATPRDNSPSPRNSANCRNSQPTLDESSPITPEVSTVVHYLQDESATKAETRPQSEASKIIGEARATPTLDGSHKLLEILTLEGCPSCQGEMNPSKSACLGFEHASQESHAKNATDRQNSLEGVCTQPENFTSQADLPVCGIESKTLDDSFYHGISNLLIECLNNIVESVKFDNREVIIKKVKPGNSSETDFAAARKASLGAEDSASLVQDLNLPVSLNPRLIIKKLPSIPRERNPSEINSVSRGIESPSEDCTNSPEDHQVPENSCTTSNTTPTESLYEREGYTTPIKRLDPKVLTVIKYNDLEIDSDEPSLNDPPESDHLECVSSQGIRLKLNPEELSNIGNFLNSKITQVHDECIHSSAAVRSFEIDEFVIDNDEPPLNLTPVKSSRIPPLPELEKEEDLEELVIDNDAPPLNETKADSDHKPKANNTDCMVISSEDEVVKGSGPPLDLSQLEAKNTKIASGMPGSSFPRPSRKKLFRKKKNSRTPFGTPSVLDLQRCRMAFRGEDPHGCTGSANQQFVDISELEYPSDGIDEIVIDVGDVGTSRQQSWERLPSLQSCREVLHQPQVFNHQGKPLLRLDSLGQFSDLSLGSPKGADTSSSSNVFPTSQVTFDLSKTFKDTPGIEFMSISDSDTVTASEGEAGEVLMISPPNTSSSAIVNRNVDTYNGCGSEVHSVDHDSDDDVIMVSGPVNVGHVNNRLHFPTPVVPPLGECIDLNARERKVRLVKTRSTPRNPPAAQVRSIRTANGNAYYVLVVPSEKQEYSRLPR